MDYRSPGILDMFGGLLNLSLSKFMDLWNGIRVFRAQAKAPKPTACIGEFRVRAHSSGSSCLVPAGSCNLDDQGKTAMLRKFQRSTVKLK